MEYKMGLQQKYFNNMKHGSKKIELRINDDKRKLLRVGDNICFMLEPDRKKSLKTKIVSLTKYKNFNEAVDNIPIDYLSSSIDTKEEYLNDLNKYYSEEEQEDYGVLAIEIQVIEKSCGLIVFKNELEKLKVLMVHQIEGHWSLPKGHVEENETEEETAIRETLEETGIETKVVSDFRKIITYYVKNNIPKDVVFFIGEATSNNIVPQITEVTEVSFIDVNAAIKLIEHDDVKEVLISAINYYQDNLITNNFYNDDDLTKEDIDETVIRTKALIINSKNQILLGYCNNTYQFPGGHLDEGETLSKCLVREVKEETGIELEEKIYVPFFLTRYYSKNYRGSLKNRENLIYYFIINTDTPYNLENTSYDEGEKLGNYELRYISLDKVEEVLMNSINDNSINKVITKEMLDALKYLEV